MNLVLSADPTLAECEAVIERGLETFVEVGRALLFIRDGKLYRESHGTFEDYCRERWDFSRAHAYRMIEASEVVGTLSPIGDTPAPANEAQARALSPLKDDPDEMAEAWSEAVEKSSGKPTARIVQESVEKRKPDPFAALVSDYPEARELPKRARSEAVAGHQALDELPVDERPRREEIFTKWIRAKVEEGELTQDQIDRRDAMRRDRERLHNLLRGWITLTALWRLSWREELLESLTDADRDAVLEIEAIYRKGIS